MEMKKCSKCNELKDFSEFSLRSKSNDGYDYKCKKCKKEIRSIYYLNNKDKEKLRNNEYNKTHNEERKISAKNYYLNNKERKLEKQKINRQQNKYKTKYKNSQNKYYKEKRKNNPLFKLSCNLRIATITALKNNSFRKNEKTEKILGCSFLEFKIYLESKFKFWMTWENYGKYNGDVDYGWDIDHIIPLSMAKTEEEIIKLCHHTNLQPLCSFTNRVKLKDKYDN